MAEFFERCTNRFGLIEDVTCIRSVAGVHGVVNNGYAHDMR
jgi:hypothetical protein